MLTEKVRKNIENAVFDVLARHDKNADGREISNLIQRWYDAKSPLIEKLRRHPNWNEDAFAVVMSIEDTREIDSLDTYYRVSDLVEYAKANGVKFDESTMTGIDILRRYHKKFIDAGAKEWLREQNIKTSEGQKASRLLNSMFVKSGADKLPEYNRLYAKIADAYNPLTIKRTSLLSVHPCDYLHMSYGTGWKSCHNIDDGCYMAGTLSYMCDGVTAIFYTTDDKYTDGGFHNKEKIMRNVFCYGDTVLMQSRLYPDNCEEKKARYREMVQKIFAECENTPNLWINKKREHIFDYCETHGYAMHYEDYIYAKYNANISLPKGFEPQKKMIIGSACYCLECGSYIDDAEYLYCDDCREVKVVCENCGDRVHENDAYYVDGEYYCRDCVYYCEYCYEWVREVFDCAGGIYVCESCLEEYYVPCEHCGEYIEINSDNCLRVQDGDVCVCINCAGERYFCCDECGELCPADECNDYNDTPVCDHCFGKLKEEESNDEDGEAA